MPTDVIGEVLTQLGVRPRAVRSLRDRGASATANWHVESVEGEELVLRRYHTLTTREDLAYEHAVLRHLSGVGWVVPEPEGPLVRRDDFWYCPTRYAAGQPRLDETGAQRHQRGRDLARLDVALRPLHERLGQRPPWRPLHTANTVHTDIDWDRGVEALADRHPRLAAWAVAADGEAQESLAALGADDLLVTIVHGDFAEWNVHYDDGRLVGVIDFGLTHLDSRPYELAIARTYRAPEAIDGYRQELARSDWPLSVLEEAAIERIYRAFRVDMVAWQLDQGRKTGTFDVATIKRHLSRTGEPAPPDLDLGPVGTL